ncbi:MAG: thiamine ABC transporter substrate-binding protein [Spirochaetes bacterium RIFOXYC1_FULL_54_7]|nr:MAG: thiamine ABC transporter substrate-binding protein [Spirochaetes bacterium RIFOXYC1_FULL_54_7]
MNTCLFVKTKQPHTCCVFIVILAFVSSLFLLTAISCSPKDKVDGNKVLVIYAYDSFVSQWGPGPVVIPLFEEATGIKVELIGAGDTGQVLARVIDEKKAPKTDIIIGIDNHLLPKAISADVLEPYKPVGASGIAPELVFDDEWRLTPFDWSTFAIIWDSEQLAVPPSSLEDLAKAEYSKKLILMDPRTSTPGLGFLAWTKAVYGDELAAYWKRLAPSVLAMAPGWDTGYGLFTRGEAPLVLSYTTSPAYHAEYETAGRYRALEFPEGHPVQIEGAGIVKGAKNRQAAEAFIDFMLSPDFQNAIPLTNWMYPVIATTVLPDSFAYAPKPAKTLLIDPESLHGLDRQALDAFSSP